MSEAGAPVGELRPTVRRLRGANGSQIDISGCSSCVVSFLGLRAEFPILVCDLSTDAIIGTDTLGSILPHTLDKKNGLLFTEGGVSLQLHRRDAALSGRVFTVGHCSIPPHYEAVLHCTTRTVGGRSLPPSGLLEGLTVFSENTGQIEPSDSPWSAPVVLVTKKNGGTQFCVDYHRLNLATVKDTYPLLRIDDILDMLAGKRWFSTLDLASGYWQVSLSPEARCQTAFATQSGLFQFRVMPFGLCNAPATFERLMDRVLQGLRWSRCLVYLDDIISFGTTFGDSLDNLTLIFERLHSYGLQLKSTKCHLFQSSVPFLGHVVSRNGLECDPRKIEDAKCWPVPDVPFIWRPACDRAFVGLRDAMVRAPILAFPTESGDYMLDTDASNFGLGGVLSQIQNDVESVIAYCSRPLRPSQRKYCTTKREMLAVVSMCIQFRSYLRGSKFTLRTDHKSLV